MLSGSQHAEALRDVELYGYGEHEFGKFHFPEPRLHVHVVTNMYFLIWTKMTTARSSRGHGGHPMSSQHRR